MKQSREDAPAVAAQRDGSARVSCAELERQPFKAVDAVETAVERGDPWNVVIQRDAAGLPVLLWTAEASDLARQQGEHLAEFGAGAEIPNARALLALARLQADAADAGSAQREAVGDVRRVLTRFPRANVWSTSTHTPFAIDDV